LRKRNSAPANASRARSISPDSVRVPVTFVHGRCDPRAQRRQPKYSSTAGRAQAQWPATRIPARETYARNRDARLLQYVCGQNPARKSRHRSSAKTGGKIATAKQARVYLSRLLKMNEAALLIRLKKAL